MPLQELNLKTVTRDANNNIVTSIQYRGWIRLCNIHRIFLEKTEFNEDGKTKRLDYQLEIYYYNNKHPDTFSLEEDQLPAVHDFTKAWKDYQKGFED